jgi:urease accessory protein
MLRVEKIVGDTSNPATFDLIHDLEHHGVVETITLSTDDLNRHRLMARTNQGNDVAIAIPRDSKLSDGAVLYLDDSRAVIVRAAQQKWLRLSPKSASDAVELGYSAGNLHWRVRFEGADLLVAQTGPAEAYLSRIPELISSGRVSVSEITE